MKPAQKIADDAVRTALADKLPLLTKTQQIIFDGRYPAADLAGTTLYRAYDAVVLTLATHVPEPESDKKITLRLKNNHKTVLPEAILIHKSETTYTVQFDPEGSFNTFPAHFWEPVPEPFVLPTGIGAVVQSVRGRGIYIRVDKNAWVSGTDVAARRVNDVTDKRMLDIHYIGGLTTLSEGADL